MIETILLILILLEAGSQLSPGRCKPTHRPRTMDDVRDEIRRLGLDRD